MTKFTPALLVFLLLTNMCCCGNSRIAQIEHEVQGENAAYSEMVDNIFEALDSNDKEALKQLFSVNTIKSTPDLDLQIEALFNFYQGPRESFDIHYLVHSEGHNEYGTQSVFLDCYFDITAGGENYFIYMSMDWRNDFNPDEKGMHIFDIATEEAAQGEFFVSHPESWEYAHGIYIQTSPEMRRDVVWEMNKPRRLDSYARVLNGDDLANFVQKNGDSFINLYSYFGEANFHFGDAYSGEYYYKYSVRKFVIVDVENGRIKLIYVATEDEQVITLWSNPDVDLWD